MSIQSVPINIHIPNLQAYVQERGHSLTILDLETTTFGGPTFGITECATLTVEGEGAAVLRAGLVNPENPISWQAEQKTGIHWKMVKDKAHWGQEWGPQMAHLCREGQTAGWGSKSFDIHRIQGQQERYGLPPLSFENHIDSYHIARRIRNVKKGTLEETAAALNIPWTSQAHRAPADVIMTALVLEGLCVIAGREQVFNFKKSLPKKQKEEKSLITLSNNEILKAARTLPSYNAIQLAEILSLPVDTLERKISDLIRDGADPAPFTCSKTQAWLQEALPSVLPHWSGKQLLRDLMNDLRNHPKAQPGLSYVQIRVALACAGIK